MNKLRNEASSLQAVQSISNTIVDMSNVSINEASSSQPVQAISSNTAGTSKQSIHFNVQQENNVSVVVEHKKQMQGMQHNGDTKAQKRKSKVSFSDLEDNFIRAGLKKYGPRKWTSILNDPEFKFHPSRKTATLQIRAKTKGIV